MFSINNTVQHIKTQFPELYSKSSYVINKKLSNIFAIYLYLNDISIIYNNHIDFNTSEILNNYEFTADDNLIISKYNTNVYAKYVYDNTLIYRYETFVSFKRKFNIISALKQRNSKLILELPSFFNNKSKVYDTLLFISINVNLKTQVSKFLADNPNIFAQLRNKLDQFNNKLIVDFQHYFKQLPPELSIYIYNKHDLYEKIFRKVNITYSLLYPVLQKYIVYLLYKYYLDNLENIQLTSSDILPKIANDYKTCLQNIIDDINDIMLSRYYIKDIDSQMLHLYHNIMYKLENFNFVVVRDKVNNCVIEFNKSDFEDIINTISDVIVFNNDLKRALFKSILIDQIANNYNTYTEFTADSRLSQKYIFLILLKLIDYVCDDLTYDDINIQDINVQDYKFEIDGNMIKTNLIVNINDYLDFIKAFYIHKLMFLK